MMGIFWRASAFVVLGLMLAAPLRAQDLVLAYDRPELSASLKAVEQAAGVAVALSLSPPEAHAGAIRSAATAGRLPALFTPPLRGAVPGEVADLSALWDEAIKAKRFDMPTRQAFARAGRDIALPLQVSRWVVFYNKAMFAEAGIEGPPRSWNLFLAACDKLKLRGERPVLATLQGGWRAFTWFAELMIRTNPDAYQGLLDGTVRYDGMEVGRAMQLWIDLYARGCFSDPRSNDEVGDFARGKGAMYLMGEAAADAIAAGGLRMGADVGVFIMPNIAPLEETPLVYEVTPLLVSAQALEQPAVARFASFLMSREGASVLAKVPGGYNGNLLSEPPNPAVRAVNALVAARPIRPMPRWWDAVAPELRTVLVSELGKFMVEPNFVTARKSMQTMQAANEAYLRTR